MGLASPRVAMAARHRSSATTLKLPFVLRISAPVPTLRDLAFLRGSNLANPIHVGFFATRARLNRIRVQDELKRRGGRRLLAGDCYLRNLLSAGYKKTVMRRFLNAT